MSAQPGNEVRLDFTGRFEDESVFATSRDDVAREEGLIDPQRGEQSEFSPLSFTVGRGEVIEGLDEAVVGMSVGQEATVTVPPAEGYGEYDPDRVREYDPEAFEEMVGRPPEIGLHVEAHNDLHGDVTAISEDAVQVDFNHELAGKTLVLEIRVLDIE